MRGELRGDSRRILVYGVCVLNVILARLQKHGGQAKEYKRNVSFNEENDSHDRMQVEEEASEAEFEIRMFSETSLQKNILAKKKLAVLATGKKFSVACLYVVFLSLAMISKVGAFAAIWITAPFLLDHR